MIVYATLLLFGIVLSALFSGMEIGIYSVGRVRLHLLSEKDPKAEKLVTLLNRPQEMVSTALVGNNISHYLCTAAFTGIILTYELSHPELWSTLVLTPLLFFLAETLPKELFRRYADQLMFQLRWFLQFFYILFLPMVKLLLGVSKFLSLIFRRNPAEFEITRQRFLHFFLEKSGLSQSQSKLAHNIFQLSEQVVYNIMQPLRKTVMVEKSWDRKKVLKLARSYKFSRYPVYEKSRRNLIGIIHIYDVILDESDDFTLEKHLRPLVKLQDQSILPQAIRRLQQTHSPMGVVVMPNGQPGGIVTVKDLMEAVVGSLRVW